MHIIICLYKHRLEAFAENNNKSFNNLEFQISPAWNTLVYEFLSKTLNYPPLDVVQFQLEHSGFIHRDKVIVSLRAKNCMPYLDADDVSIKSGVSKMRKDPLYVSFTYLFFLFYSIFCYLEANLRFTRTANK